MKERSLSARWMRQIRVRSAFSLMLQCSQGAATRMAATLAATPAPRCLRRRGQAVGAAHPARHRRPQPALHRLQAGVAHQRAACRKQAGSAAGLKRSTRLRMRIMLCWSS